MLIYSCHITIISIHFLYYCFLSPSNNLFCHVVCQTRDLSPPSFRLRFIAVILAFNPDVICERKNNLENPSDFLDHSCIPMNKNA